MEIKFLGTRGYIDVATKKHKRHTSTLISYRGKKLMIDCGIDWTDKVWKIKPDAIIITHSHPDHAWGLKLGSPCNVWATAESWELMKKYEIPLKQRKLIIPHIAKTICGIKVEAFEEVHSILAPAVGYRIKAGRNVIYYAGDIVYIKERKEALKGISLYIGDGATISRPMIRKNKKTGELFGHATVQIQITWCQKEGVPRAIITHCGSQIVKGGSRAVAKIKAIGKMKNIAIQVAYDGMKIKI